MGTSVSSTRPGPDQRIPKNQFFQKEQRHHQLWISLGNHNKTLPVTATSGLFIPTRGKTSSIKHQPLGKL
jgi:hypothetical protein